MGGKGRTTINQPDPIDPGKAMGEYLFGRGFTNYQGVTDPRLQQKILDAESRYRPQYAALELQDINTFLYGTKSQEQQAGFDAQQQVVRDLENQLQASKGKKLTKRQRGELATLQFFRKRLGISDDEYEQKRRELLGVGDRDKLSRKLALERQKLNDLRARTGTSGLFDLLEEGGRRSAQMQRESLEAQRESDVQAIQDFAPQIVDAYRDANPYSTALAEQTQRRAMGQLTPDEERDIQQQARQAAMARGRTGASAEFGEVLGRRAFTDQYTQPAFQMNQALAGDLGMTILGRPSGGLAMGANMLGQATQSAAGPMGPQLFDPNMGINMAMQQRSQDMNLLGAQAQADATRSAGMMNMIGTVAGAAIPMPGCWVAREVYGEHNPRWVAFRHWLVTKSPSWFRNLYIKYGEKFAKFISNKPFIKKLIRKWMDTRIK